MVALCPKVIARPEDEGENSRDLHLKVCAETFKVSWVLGESWLTCSAVQAIGRVFNLKSPLRN